MMIFQNIGHSSDGLKAAAAEFDDARRRMLVAFQGCLDSGFSKLAAQDEIEGTENAMNGIVQLASGNRR